MKSRNRIHAIAAVILFFAAVNISVRAQAPDIDAAAALAVVRAYHEALKVGDSLAVLRLLAPDAVILEGGGRETREEYRDHHLQEDIKFSQSVTTRPGAAQVVVSGDVAWVSSTSVTQGTYQKRPVNLSDAELMVLSRTSTGWTIRAIHWSSRKSTSGG